MPLSRRSFLGVAGAAAWQSPTHAQRQPVKIGVDLYSLRLNNWTPFQYIDYLAGIGVQVAHLSTVRELSPMLTDEAALGRVKTHAAGRGVELELAMGSICTSAREYNPKLGTPEEQIARVLNAARLIGAPVVRCILGGASERTRAMPIEAHMENVLRVLRAAGPRIVDSGIKLAMENHGGDFQARELRWLVEAAGKGVLYVCLDSGNPPYNLEDPHLTLETLGPYAATTHVRDTAVWRVPEGVAARWVRIGDGNVDLRGWIEEFVRMRPDLAVSVENIVSPAPYIERIFDAQFWEAYPKMPAWEFCRFLSLADKGKPVPALPPEPGRTPGQQQCVDLEASLSNLRAMLRSV